MIGEIGPTIYAILHINWAGFFSSRLDHVLVDLEDMINVNNMERALMMKDITLSLC